jgi:hypothetical protein
MRLRMECSGAFARYLLTVEMDGRAIATDTVRGGGLRNDRPMHVFEEFDTSPGSHQLRVSLVRIEATQDSSGTTRDSTVATAGTLLGERESRERDERQRRAGEAIPASLVLDTVVNLGPGGVVLVTYDGQVDRLVALTGKQP